MSCIFIAGSIMFHVRRRPADYMPRKRKKKPAGKWNELDHRYVNFREIFMRRTSDVTWLSSSDECLVHY